MATLVTPAEKAEKTEKQVPAVPEEKPERSPFGEEIGKAYLIGIERFVEIEPVSVVSAIGLGAYQTYFWVKMTLLSVVKIFQGSVSRSRKAKRDESRSGTTGISTAPS